MASCSVSSMGAATAMVYTAATARISAAQRATLEAVWLPVVTSRPGCTCFVSCVIFQGLLRSASLQSCSCGVFVSPSWLDMRSRVSWRSACLGLSPSSRSAGLAGHVLLSVLVHQGSLTEGCLARRGGVRSPQLRNWSPLS